MSKRVVAPKPAKRPHSHVALRRIISVATENAGPCDSVTVSFCVPRAWWANVKREMFWTRATWSDVVSRIDTYRDIVQRRVA